MTNTSPSLSPGAPLTAAALAHGWPEGENPAPLLLRVGKWMRRGRPEGLAEVESDEAESTEVEPQDAPAPSGAAFMTRGRRSGAVRSLQKSVSALSDLSEAIRQDLDRGAERQDQLLRYLSHLPKVLQQLPDGARIHGDALRAIHHQIERQAAQHAAQQAAMIEQRARDTALLARQAAEQADQHAGQQERLAGILEGLTAADVARGEAVGSLAHQVETLARQEQQIIDGLARFGDEVARLGENLNQFGTVVQSAADQSEATARVLEQIRNDLARREGVLEQALRRHNTRFTSMLAVAITSSVAAMTSVIVIGYMMLSRLP